MTGEDHETAINPSAVSLPAEELTYVGFRFERIGEYEDIDPEMQAEFDKLWALGAADRAADRLTYGVIDGEIVSTEAGK
jgi:hypothetical protein